MLRINCHSHIRNTRYTRLVYNFEKYYGLLNKQQRQAVDLIDGPLLVLAGPGTGKTQLLSARVANILKLTDTPAQNILCLTFTDAAALNMRERLMSMIGETAYDVHINTYHSFASDIIKSYPEFFETIDLETGKDSRLERPIDELRQLQVVKEIIDKLPFTDPLRSARHYLKSVVSTVSDFKQANLRPADVKQIAKANAEACLQLSPKVHELYSPYPRMPKLAVAQDVFTGILAVLETSKQAVAQNAAEELDEALTVAAEDNTTKPLTSWKNQWLVKDENDAWCFTNPEHSAKLVSLADIYTKYQEVLETSSQYDFNDMIIRSIDALVARPELRYNLQEKYQYILLDEFQDTNATQFELVKLLADHPVHEGRPNIMAVGDDDQGIFAFQGADIGNMVAFLATFRDVAIINLVKNYRSHHDILHVAHNIAEQIESRLHHNLENISKDIEAASESAPAKALIERHEFTSQASECGWIADTIEKLIKQGVEPKEIAVLAPKHAILETLVPFINMCGVPVSYEKRENIFETPVIQAVLLTCEFLLAASQQSSEASDTLLPKVMSLDFWGVPTKDIWQLNWAFHSKKFKGYQPWAALALENKQAKQPAEFLLHLATQVDTLSLEAMLDFITGAKPISLDDGTEYTSPLKDFYFGEDAKTSSSLAFYEAISHLSVIRSHLRDQQAQTDRQLRLEDLLLMYETYQEAEQPLLNTHPIAQSQSAVQLQTVYKAKGLEYEYVFLPSMQDDVWGSTASSGSNKVSLPPNLKHIRHDSSTEDTRRRLLFVAITRAKHGLFSTSYAQKENGKKTLPVKYYQEQADGEGRVSGILPAGAGQVLFTERAGEQAMQDIDTLWHSRHTHINPELRSLLSERLAHYTMSPTHLNTFTNLEYAGPSAFLLNTLLRFPEAPSADSIYGASLHDCLEWFQKQGANEQWPSVAQVVKRFEQAMSHTFLPDADKTIYTDRGRHALKTYLGANAEQLKNPAKAEVDFRNEGVVLDGARLTGKIDRLEINEEAKTVRIVDFKSGTPSTKWSAATKYKNYKQQLYFYVLLIEKSHSYKGYKVEQAALEFIEPLGNGKAAPPLALEFNQEEYEKFKKLISVVWQRIMTLDFPDISKYTPNLQGTLQFEDDLLK